MVSVIGCVRFRMQVNIRYSDVYVSRAAEKGDAFKAQKTEI